FALRMTRASAVCHHQRLYGGMMLHRLGSVVVVAAAGVVSLSGCTTLPEAARQELIRAHQAYEQGELGAAESGAGKVIGAYPHAREIGEAYYVRGLARARQGRTSEAETDFREAIKRSQRRDLRGRAGTSLGMVLQERGEFGKAASSYEGAMANLEAGEVQATAMYNLGVCRQREGQWSEARGAFESFLRKYPSSAEAAQAHRRAAWPHEHFAIQCGVFGEAGNARRMLEQLRRENLQAYVEAHGGERLGGASAVRVGRFRDYGAAARALPMVKRVVADAYIVP
ncbi:MAG: tetratricopeptide repeat protein, partial [Phycisphaerales bacterium]